MSQDHKLQQKLNALICNCNIHLCLDKLQGQPAAPPAPPDEADRDRAEGRHGPVLQPVQVQHKQLLRG